MHNIIEIHWHEWFEILFIVEGRIRLELNHRPLTIEPGDIVLINSGQLHAAYASANSYTEFYAVVFDRSLLLESVDPADYALMASFWTIQIPFPNLVPKDCLLHQRIEHRLHDIIADYTEEDLGAQTALRSHLALLLLTVFRHYRASVSDGEEQGLFAHQLDRFKQLLGYIEEHYHEKITVAQAARVQNLSAFHFCKTFKQLTGKTFVEFLNLYRLNQAERLLVNTSLPMTDIAERTGFCNANYFTKLFTRYKGLAPTKMRKKLMETRRNHIRIKTSNSTGEPHGNME